MFTFVNMEIKDRIELVLHFKNLSPSQFAESINVQRSSVSHILSGRNKPSLDFITKVVQTFPEVSFDWLIAGNGGLNEQTETTVNKGDSLTSGPDTPVNNTPDSAEIEQKTATQAISKPVETAVNSGGVESTKRTIAQVILCYDDNTFETLSPPSLK